MLTKNPCAKFMMLCIFLPDTSATDVNNFLVKDAFSTRDCCHVARWHVFHFFISQPLFHLAFAFLLKKVEKSDDLKPKVAKEISKCLE